MKIETKVIHAGLEHDSSTGAVMTPIYQTTTFKQERPGIHKGFEYSRTQNPTRAALESNIAALENAKYGLCFSSGMSAIDAIARTLNPGDEVVASNDVYGGTYRLFTKIYEGYGIKTHFVDFDNYQEIQDHINDNTKLIWLETPTNPLIHIIDIEKITELKKGRDLIVAVDNTFATPYLQRPMEFGADIVVHSLTKYMGGHSDTVMGALALNDDALAEKLYFIQNSAGAVPGPMDSFLVLRGIKTLHIRMDRHSENALKIANYLQTNEAVSDVYYPGLESHPNHQVAKKQMKAYGGMLSFRLADADYQSSVDFISKLSLFTLAESLGGVESLIGHPASMTHAAMPKESREARGVSDTLIRMSVGIESAEDLIEDLKQALHQFQPKGIH